MPRYDFAEQAERDLEAIIDYTLEHWGQRQATDYLNQLETLAETLAERPDIGVKRDALFDGLISFPYRSHILYYVKQRHGITIVRVLHKRMDPERHLSAESPG